MCPSGHSQPRSPGSSSSGSSRSVANWARNHLAECLLTLGAILGSRNKGRHRLKDFATLALTQRFCLRRLCFLSFYLWSSVWLKREVAILVFQVMGLSIKPISMKKITPNPRIQSPPQSAQEKGGGLYLFFFCSKETFKTKFPFYFNPILLSWLIAKKENHNKNTFCTLSWDGGGWNSRYSVVLHGGRDFIFIINMSVNMLFWNPKQYTGNKLCRLKFSNPFLKC